MVKEVVLGQVDYFGEQATAVREVYPECWKFVLVTPSLGRVVLATY